MVKRNNVVALLLLVFIIGLIGCTSSKPSAPPDESSPMQTDPSPPVQTADPNPDDGAYKEKYTITMLDYRYSTLPPIDGKAIGMINKRFNVDYKPEYITRSDYALKLTTTVASGGMPDIIVLENMKDPNLFKWAKQGGFLSLDEYYEEYETLKQVPEHIRKALTVDGSIIGIPSWATENYSLTAMIRQDWLDNLGLSMPTNYEELKAVALAFTNGDPYPGSNTSTYGMVMSETINPQYHMGAYWDQLAWYHQDADGNYIPGIISDARREHIQWLRDLYEAGAITHDFALINWGQAYTEFYSGKAGIFIGAVTGIGNNHMEALLEIQPEAKLAMIPPFKAPDGSQGFAQNMGAGRAILLNAKLKDQPDKVRRILDMLEMARTFHPLETRNASNEPFDWLYGYEGVGYEIVNGIPVREPDESGLSPVNYFADYNMWAPSDGASEPWKQFSTELHRQLSEEAARMHDTTKHYLGPDRSIFSPLLVEKELELIFMMYDEQTKLIVGNVPMSEWDNIVQKYMDAGGAEMIREVNEAIREAGVQPEWR